MRDNSIELIKARLDIEEIIGDYVKLQRSGRNYKGLCPFHQEKTPSFYVSPERQSWHCFGCGKGGDIFSFIMEIESLSFPEALDLLGKRAGVEIVKKKGQSQSRDRNLYDLMEMACSFYRDALLSESGKVGRLYLERRKLFKDSYISFELGWSQPSWRDLLNYMRAKKVSEKDLIGAGLVVEGERGNYDRFRGRIIFPIRDISGRLIAFGGRIIDGDGAKYLNSPESEIYRKRKTLYLIDKAKANIRSSGYSIIVEGYMDAIRLHIAGYNQTVATLGTSLTEEQASILKRLADNVYICYDSDGAGQAAALRGMYVLQSAGLSVKVLSLEEGKDPDDLLSNSGGKKLFQSYLEKALPLVRHHIKIVKPLLKDPQNRKKAIEEFFEGLGTLHSVDLAPYIPEIASLLGVRDFEVQDEMRYRKKKGHFRKSGAIEPVLREEKTSEELPDRMEAALFCLLWNNLPLRMETSPQDVLSLVSDERIKIALASLYSGNSTADLERRWLQMGDTFPLEALSLGGAYIDSFSGNSRWLFEHFRETLFRQRARIRYNELRLKMRKGEATKEEISEHGRLKQKFGF